MAHFAQLDNDKTVINVIVIHNNELLDESGVEKEQKGIDFCKSLYGSDTTWVQTSYNNSFRKKFAGIGFSYDVDRDVFISPKPFPSWTFDENILDWQSPVPKPDDHPYYIWDEDSQSWMSTQEVL